MPLIRISVHSITQPPDLPPYARRTQGPLELATAMGRDDTANYLRELKAAADAVKFAAKMKMKSKKAAEAAADALPTLGDAAA